MGEMTDMQQTTNPEHWPAREGLDTAYRRLRQDYIEGRMTLVDFEAQVERVYASYGETESAVRSVDIPARGITRPRPSRRAQVVPYAMVMALLLGIWAMTGMGYFWPIWPMLGWGIPVMLGVMGMGSGCDAHAANTRQRAPSPGGHHQN